MSNFAGNYINKCQSCHEVGELYPVIIKGHQFLFCEECYCGATMLDENAYPWAKEFNKETKKVNEEWFEERGKKLLTAQ